MTCHFFLNALISIQLLQDSYSFSVLALFLASIGNPPPHTINGQSEHGICRPPYSTVLDIIQSTATVMHMSQSSLYASTAQQGAGLINAFRTLTATTIFSPSTLALNDTVRRLQRYTVQLLNIGTEIASYKLTHQGAALATGMQHNDDQQLRNPIFSEDFAVCFYKSNLPGRSQTVAKDFYQ